MWYECLPSMFIIAGCISAPNFLAYYINKYLCCEGNPHHRNIMMPGSLIAYFRDERLSGNAYIMKGLEALPDEPETSASKK